MIDFSQVAEFIDLVQNPDKYAKAVQQMEERQKSIKELISVAGKAQEIPNLHALAELKVKKAEEEAKGIVENAKKLAETTLASARQVEKAATDKTVAAETAMTEAKSLKAKADQLMKDHQAASVVLQKQQDNLLEREEVLRKAEAEVNEKLAKLRSLNL